MGVGWWLRGGAAGAVVTVALWLAAEAAAEASFHVARYARGSRVAGNLCNWPSGDNARARAASLRAVTKLFAMMCFVPGSAAPWLAAAAAHIGGAAPLPNYVFFPAHLALYPAAAVWLAFAIFVKFAFVVFGVNTLCGFEDYDPPGWLLG